jgi:hypothetical protein
MPLTDQERYEHIKQRVADEANAILNTASVKVCLDLLHGLGLDRAKQVLTVVSRAREETPTEEERARTKARADEQRRALRRDRLRK